MQQVFGITVTAKLRHADLWEAAKRLGSQAALARALDLCPNRLCRWVNLREAPNWQTWDEANRVQISDRFLSVTGKMLEELFPVELIDAINHPDFIREIEQRRDVNLRALASAVEQRNLLPSPDTFAERSEAKELVYKHINSLGPRLRRVLELRFGLDGGKEHTFEEIGEATGVSKERVRQLMLRGMRKLRERFDNIRRPHAVSGSLADEILSTLA